MALTIKTERSAKRALEGAPQTPQLWTQRPTPSAVTPAPAPPRRTSPEESDEDITH